MFCVVALYLHFVRLFFDPGCVYVLGLMDGGMTYIVAVLIIVLALSYLKM